MKYDLFELLNSVDDVDSVKLGTSLPPVPLATDSSSSIRRPPMIFCHVSGSFTILSCNASRRDPVGECLDDVTRRQSWSDLAKRAERERGGKTRTFLDTEFL